MRQPARQALPVRRGCRLDIAAHHARETPHAGLPRPRAAVGSVGLVEARVELAGDPVDVCGGRELLGHDADPFAAERHRLGDRRDRRPHHAGVNQLLAREAAVIVAPPRANPSVRDQHDVGRRAADVEHQRVRREPGDERGGRKPVRRGDAGPVRPRRPRVDEPLAGKDEHVGSVDHALERLEDSRHAARAIGEEVDELAGHRQRMTGTRRFAAGELRQCALEILAPEPERARPLCHAGEAAVGVQHRRLDVRAAEVPAEDHRSLHSAARSTSTFFSRNAGSENGRSPSIRSSTSAAGLQSSAAPRPT